MSAQPHSQPLPGTPTAAMLRTLGGVATLSGLLVVLAFKLTLPRIEANQRRATEQAVFQIVPQAVVQRPFALTPQGLQPVRLGDRGGEEIYAAYDAAGTLQGVALPGAGQGYADLIRVLYAYRPDCACISGVKVLKMAETPGIGDRLVSDAEFQHNFQALDVHLNAKGDGLAHPIVAVKHGSKQASWQIDAISGATISSRGMAKALDSSAERLLPRLERQLAKLRAAGQEVRSSQAQSTSSGG
jgi:electron transport complex protein RnfG